MLKKIDHEVQFISSLLWVAEDYMATEHQRALSRETASSN